MSRREISRPYAHDRAAPILKGSRAGRFVAPRCWQSVQCRYAEYTIISGRTSFVAYDSSWLLLAVAAEAAPKDGRSNWRTQPPKSQPPAMQHPKLGKQTKVRFAWGPNQAQSRRVPKHSSAMSRCRSNGPEPAGKKIVFGRVIFARCRRGDVPGRFPAARLKSKMVISGALPLGPSGANATR